MNTTNTETWTPKLVDSSDPILRIGTPEVTDFDKEVAPYFKPMLELMRASKGIGLAAPQVGLRARFFVTDIPGLKLVVNPKILNRFGHRVSKQEGCLSFPQRHAFVVRHQNITVEYLNQHKRVVTATLSDYHARVFQHETDHLFGVCMFP